jgi:hypothetical protein
MEQTIDREPPTQAGNEDLRDLFQVALQTKFQDDLLQSIEKA